MRHQIILTVTGEVEFLEVESYRTLLQVLREDLDLTGTDPGGYIGCRRHQRVTTGIARRAEAHGHTEDVAEQVDTPVPHPPLGVADGV